MMRKIEREPNGRGEFRPGQDLVAAGCIGKRGVRIAAEKKKELLRSRFSEDFFMRLDMALDEKLNLTPDALDALGATEWEYVKEGGILAALWNISGAYGRGISFSLLKIPVQQEIIEVCEYFDLNPYRLWSEECLVIAADHGWDLADALRERGIPAAVIGKAEQGIARKMTGVGGTAGFLERPKPDEIYKLG